MRLFVLVNQEHFEKFCELHNISHSDVSLQIFLKEIGTPCLRFQPLDLSEKSNYMAFKEVPTGSCIRLRLQEEYVATIHKKLFQASYEKSDKSQRGNSCSIV